MKLITNVSTFSLAKLKQAMHCVVVVVVMYTLTNFHLTTFARKQKLLIITISFHINSNINGLWEEMVDFNKKPFFD